MEYKTEPCQQSRTNDMIDNGAEDQVAKNAENTVFDTKHLIGRRYDDNTLQSDVKHWPFKVINRSGKPGIEVEYLGEQKTFVTVIIKCYPACNQVSFYCKMD